MNAERLRMALAEAGYPNAIVDSDTCHITTYREVRGEPTERIPQEVAWRAFSTARFEDVPCLACFLAMTHECAAVGNGTLDCGRRHLTEVEA